MSITWYPGQSLEANEKEIILWYMRYMQNNKTRVAESLGIAIRTLDGKLEKYANKEVETTDIHQERISDYHRRSGFKPQEFDAASEASKRAADLEYDRRQDYLKRSGYGKGGMDHPKNPEQKRSSYDGLQNRSGDGLEPNSKDAEKQSVSMSERKEIQELPSKKHATGHSKSGR